MNIQTISIRIITILSFFLNGSAYGSQITGHTTNNPVVRATAQEYNKRIPLIALPKEVVLSGMIDRAQPLKQSIENSLSLTLTCVHFNNVLPYLGFLHKCYPDEEKNKLLRSIGKSLYVEQMGQSLRLWGPYVHEDYWRHRRMMLLLMHASISPGLDTKGSVAVCDLRSHACYHDDVEMVTAMLGNGVLPSELVEWTRTKKIALVVDEFCVKHDIDFQEVLKNCPLILFSCMSVSGNADLVKFYLDKHINSANKRYGINILHQIARISRYEPSPRISEIAELLLKSIPNIINEKNDTGETPLDLMFSLVNIPFFGQKYIEQSQLVQLFRKYGAQRSDELEKDKQLCLMPEKAPEKTGWLHTKMPFLVLPCSIVIVAGLYLWKR